MKLKQYANHINELAKKYPNAEVVYAADEEGNNFSNVFYEPSYGHFDGNMFENNGGPTNAVCVN